MFGHIKSFCFLAALVALPTLALAQAPTVQDCQGAIPVCGWTFQQDQPFTGSGNVPHEVNSSISCLDAGEINSVWYTFTTQTAGNVNFTITPNNPSNDYDWAVFNLTHASCAQIYTDASLLVSCNFIEWNGPTGANGGPLPQNNPVIAVGAGETYVLIVTNYSTTNQQGYKLDFSASTAQIFDNAPPTLAGVAQPVPCNTDNITVAFSENIRCSDLDMNTFSVTGPDGTHNITAIYNANCAAGASYASSIQLTFSPELTTSGTYTVTLNHAVNDLCDNALAPGATLTFNHTSLTVDNTFSTMADCLQNNGSAGIAVSGGVPPLTYAWSPGGQTTPTAVNLFADTYTVTVQDQNACKITETITVANPVNFAVSYTQIPDTCEKGNGTVTATANGTSGPFTYLWNTPTNPDQPTQHPVRGNTAIGITVTDADGCVIRDTVTIQNMVNDSLLAAFTATPNPVDILFPKTKLVNGSLHYDTYKWIIPEETVTNNANPVVTFPDWGDYPVTLYVYDKNGCADTAEEKILVRGDLYYYIPNAFTPDENNLNETWHPQGVGFEKSSYKMIIYDRWGNIVHQSGDTDFGWDGRDTKGQPCPQDMYTYRITMEGHEGLVPVFRGNVMLVR